MDDAWLQQRERDLLARVQVDLTGIGAASSGCAESAAHRLAHKRSADAELALSRLRDGLTGTCATCGGAIPIERLQAVLTAVRCATC